MELKTERLLLRPITEADAEATLAYAKGPNVGPNAGWKPHENLEETHQVLKEVFLDKENIWGIVFEDTLIGSIGLMDDPKRQNPHTKMLGYAIGEAYWGNGIMTEAARAVLAYGFETLQIDLISGYCYTFNTRSRRVLEKCGMRLEGQLRMAEERSDGEIFDEFCFSITRGE